MWTRQQIPDVFVAMQELILGTRQVLPQKRPAPIPVLEPAPTAEYGKYIASTTCIECHGDRLQGGKHPDPNAPLAPPLGPTSAWTDEQFATTMRTGQAPGRQISKFMPWESYAHLTDTEIGALRAYIRTVASPAQATN